MWLAAKILYSEKQPKKKKKTKITTQSSKQRRAFTHSAYSGLATMLTRTCVGEKHTLVSLSVIYAALFNGMSTSESIIKDKILICVASWEF